MAFVSQATKSAAKPGAILPMSSRPKFLAPPLMHSFNASREFITARHRMSDILNFKHWKLLSDRSLTNLHSS